MIRVTLACPKDLMPEANQLMMVLGGGPEDAKSFLHANWVTEQGVAYSAASTVVPENWTGRISSGLVRPKWDVAPHVIDLEAAERARRAVVKRDLHTESEGVLLDADKIAVVCDMPGRRALSALGLKQVQGDDGA